MNRDKNQPSASPKKVRASRTPRSRALEGIFVLLVSMGCCYYGWKAFSAPDKAAPFQAHMVDSPFKWEKNSRTYTDFTKALASGQVKEAGVSSSQMLITLKTGEKFAVKTNEALVSNDVQRLTSKGAAVAMLGQPAKSGSSVFSFIVDLCLALAALAVLTFLVAATALRAKGLGPFSRGPEVLDAGAGDADYEPGMPKEGFSSVIGAENAKRALRQVTAFLTSPKTYAAIGAKPFRGVLLEGPPGTGKTLLAKALAAECGASFIPVDGSYFSSKYMGEGIGKVQALFARARKSAPCVIFIDEIDGLGKRSSHDDGSTGGQESRRIINKILVEMDGFKQDEGVVVLAATNHRNLLDDALLREGRFDLTVRVDLPSKEERTKLFAHYLGKVKAAAKVNPEELALTAHSMSPAAIAGAVNLAAVRCAEAGMTEVTQEQLLVAIERKQLGGDPDGNSALTESARVRLAYHEAGHALAAHHLKAGAVTCVSIEPRGNALGVTVLAPLNEDNLFKPEDLVARLAMMLAGREAELVYSGVASSGASDDLRRATELAWRYVGEMGMSEEFGLVSMRGLPAEAVSAPMKEALLREVQALLKRAQSLARGTLEAKQHSLNEMVQELLQNEYVKGERLSSVLNA